MEKEGAIENAQVVLYVPRRLVKKVKSALENQNAINRTTKITPDRASNGDRQTESRMRIPTTIPYPPSEPTNNDFHTTVLTRLNLLEFDQEITTDRSTQPSTPSEPQINNPLLKALKPALEALPLDLLSSLALTPTHLLTTFPTTYTLYKPLVLLPPTLLAAPAWKTLLTAHPLPSPALTPRWTPLAASLHATHIAINTPIPPHTTNPNHFNTLRSPTNIHALHPPSGLGPSPTPQSLTASTPSDFASALWVAHTQNGITQVWAPLYTMFSRGNIREKTRLLTLPSVTALAAGQAAAADLYAGIGYFAFSYRRAGIRPVLCWEVNPWSVEGLRRGAERNGWRVGIVRERVLASVREGMGRDGVDEEGWGALKEEVRAALDKDFVVFPCSNELAAPIVRAVWGTKRDVGMPPIRHVNLGLLPSSRGAWRAAVEVVDWEVGGWVHVHENVGVGEVDVRKEEVLCAVRGYVEERWGGEEKNVVRCGHVERVKTYAPGVLHVVFDVWVGPGEDGGKREGFIKVD